MILTFVGNVDDYTIDELREIGESPKLNNVSKNEINGEILRRIIGSD